MNIIRVVLQTVNRNGFAVAKFALYMHRAAFWDGVTVKVREFHGKYLEPGHSTGVTMSLADVAF